MAPDDFKLDKWARLESVVGLVDGPSEKPEKAPQQQQQQQQARPQEGAKEHQKAGDEQGQQQHQQQQQQLQQQQQQQQQEQAAADTEASACAMSPGESSPAEGSQKTVELTRPIVNGRQRVSKYGACDEAAGANRLAAQPAAGAAGRPRTLSAYIIGKNWANFGASAKGEPEKGAGGDPDAGPACQAKKTALERAAKHVPGLGIIMSLCASLFLGTAGMLVKLTTSVHGIEVAVMRAAIQLVIYAAIIGGRRLKWMPSREEFWPVALRAGLGGLSITLSYSALKLIPLGDATTIRFSLPIWTLIMSYFFLRESCGSFKIFAVVISISGVVLVTKPDMCVMLLHRLLNTLNLESSAELGAHERAYERARVEELASLMEAPLSAGDADFVPLVSLSANQLITGANSQLTNQTLAYTTTPMPLQMPSQMRVAPLANMSGAAAAAGTANISLDSQPSATTLAPALLTYSTDAVRQFEGCLMALGSSICLSISIIALRLCRRTPSEVCIFWLSTLSIVIGSLTLVAMGEWSVPDNVRDILYILLNGVCGALGQWFMTSALKIEQSGVIALARTFDIEVAFLYSAFLLGEEIRMTSILGSVLVSLGVVSVVVPKWLGCGERDTAAAERQSEVAVTNDTDSISNRSASTAEFEGHPTIMITTTNGVSNTFEGQPEPQNRPVTS